jgi:hypothetical protein
VGVESWAGSPYLSRSCKRGKNDSRESGLHVEQEGWRENKIAEGDCGALEHLYIEMEECTHRKSNVQAPLALQ